MNIKRFFIATILSAFGMWVVAGLWHNLIMANLYKDIHATHDGIGLLLISYFILAFFMVYLYSLIYKGKASVLEGLRIGIIVGLLWVFPHGLVMAGAHGTSILYVFKNSAWHIIEQGIGGIIVGFIYGKIK